LITARRVGDLQPQDRLALGQRLGSSRLGWPTQIVGVAGSMPRSASFEDFETASMPSARWISATCSSPGVSHSGTRSSA
jgi:hypothetical protein